MSLFNQFQNPCLLLQAGYEHESINKLLELISSPAFPPEEDKISFLNRNITFPMSGECGLVSGKSGALVLPHHRQKEKMHMHSSCIRKGKPE